MDVCLLWVLSGRGLCNGLITRPEEFYRLWHFVVCDQETSKMRRLKVCYWAVKIQPQWVVAPGKQTNNTNILSLYLDYMFRKPLCATICLMSQPSVLQINHKWILNYVLCKIFYSCVTWCPFLYLRSHLYLNCTDIAFQSNPPLPPREHHVSPHGAASMTGPCTRVHCTLAVLDAFSAARDYIHRAEQSSYSLSRAVEDLPGSGKLCRMFVLGNI